MDQFVLSEIGKEIFSLRYAFSPEETWEQACWRVANIAAQAEEIDKRAEIAQLFFDNLYNQFIIPGGRILYGAGREKQQLSNCFALGVEDSRESLGKLFSDVMIISSSGGGIGINFSELRPFGDPIRSIGGIASGPISFAMVIDKLGEIIKAGGSRRAAFIALLSINHPDIELFIDSKANRSQLTNMNISVLVDNKFLKRVQNDEMHPLTFRGKVYREIRARDLWEKIIKNAISNGEPGIINEENIRKGNNSEYFAPFSATNPCITGDTKVAIMGSQGIEWEPIEKLAKENKDLDVLTLDNNFDISISKMRNPRITALESDILEIEIENGHKIRCTPNHKFLLSSGEYKEAKDLLPIDSLVITIPTSDVQADYYPRELRNIEKDLVSSEIVDLNPMSQRAYIKAINEGYQAFLFNEEVFVNKKCEYCKKSFSTPYKEREVSFCSISCSNEQEETRKKSRNINLEKKELLDHKVISVVLLPNKETVYTGTVDKTHNFICGGWEEDNKIIGLVSRQCGELALSRAESCTLISVNLSKMWKVSRSGNSVLDVGRYKKSVTAAVRFLDNIISINNYPLVESRLAITKTRRIGLGVMGFHHFLIRLGIEYGDNPSCLEIIDELGRILRDESYRASIELAKTRGSFEGYDADKYTQMDFIRRLPVSIRREISKYGIRNCSINCIAPTGTTSLLANTSSGIEPIYAPIFLRRYFVGAEIQKEVTLVDPIIKEMIQADLPISHVKASLNISLEDHFAVLSAWQYWIDGNISKTLNIPMGYKDEETSNIVLNNLPNLKGFTIYQDGSRENQPLTPIEVTDDILQLIKNNQLDSLIESKSSCKDGLCEL